MPVLEREAKFMHGAVSNPFEQYFQTTMLANLKDIESWRSALAVRRGICNLAIFLATMLALNYLGCEHRVFMARRTDIINPVVTPLILVIAFVLYRVNVQVNGHNKWFVAEYKKDVIGNVIRFFSADFLYEPSSRLGADVVNRSQLFSADAWTTSYGDDLLSIRLDGLPEIRMCELHLVTVASNGDTSSRTNVFGGLFATMQLSDKPPVQGTFTDRDAERVTRDLPPDPWLTALLQHRGHFSYVDRDIYLVVPMEQDLFEPDVSRSITSFDDVQTWFNCYDVVFKSMRALATPYL